MRIVTYLLYAMATFIVSVVAAMRLPDEMIRSTFAWDSNYLFVLLMSWGSMMACIIWTFIYFRSLFDLVDVRRRFEGFAAYEAELQSKWGPNFVEKVEAKVSSTPT